MTGSSQHGSVEGKSGLTSLIAFYAEMTGFGQHEGRAAGIVYLSLGKASTLSPTTSS